MNRSAHLLPINSNKHYRPQAKVRATIPFLIFFAVIGFASWSPASIAFVWETLQAFGALLIFLSLMGIARYRNAILKKTNDKFSDIHDGISDTPTPNLIEVEISNSRTKNVTLSLLKYSGLLLALYSLFFMVSMLFFDLLETLTNLNPRVQALEVGSFVTLLKTNFTIGFFPWVLYGLVGAVLAYYTMCRDHKPIFSDIIIPDHKQQPRLFIHNYFLIATEVVRVVPFILLMVMAIYYNCHLFSHFFKEASIYETPFRSLFVILIIFLFLRKPQEKLLQWMQDKKIPLGGMMVLMCLSIACLMCWVQITGSLFTMGVEITDPNKVVKSVLASGFSEEVLNTRLSFLLWGWWAVWLPWMSSLVARLSKGRKVWEVCLVAVILPALFFYGLTQFSLVQFETVHEIFNASGAQIFILLFLILWMLLFFGHIHTTLDVSRAGLLRCGKRWHLAPFRKWLTVLCMGLLCFLMAISLLAWLPVQVICATGGFFMMTVVLGLAWRLLFP